MKIIKLIHEFYPVLARLNNVQCSTLGVGVGVDGGVGVGVGVHKC